MRRNMFGEEQPENYADLMGIINDRSLDVSGARVEIMDNSGDGGDERFNGWCAEISGDADDGEGDTELLEINTCAWPDKDSLLADLKACGFRRIDDTTGV
jgi:hypothetical protein